MLDRAVSAKTSYLTSTNSTVTFGILLKTFHLIDFISLSNQAMKFSSVLEKLNIKPEECLKLLRVIPAKINSLIKFISLGEQAIKLSRVPEKVDVKPRMNV